MAPVSKAVFSALLLSVIGTASPIGRSYSPVERRWECPAGNETQKIWIPETWNIYPQQPRISRGPASGIELEAFGGKSQLEQVAVFGGIPKEAKSCALGWSQADKTDRVFLVDGAKALVNVRPLGGFPPEGRPVTSAAIAPFNHATEEEELHPDFTFWDDVDAASHVAGQVDCAEELYFKMSLADPSVKSHIYLKSDKQNGFWLEFSC